MSVILFQKGFPFFFFFPKEKEMVGERGGNNQEKKLNIYIHINM